MEFGTDREQLRRRLEQDNIEARPLWKPMHLQPVFNGYQRVNGEVAEELFSLGLCLPSGSSMTLADLRRVVDIVQSTHDDALNAHAMRTA
jgi:dTDP-4-amino-4,6-dideoxygalactose transaminase